MVFVLDKRKKPLMPCTEKRARQLLEKGRAVVDRIEPFTIRLKDRTQEESQLQPLRLKIDPGSKTTGMSILRENGEKADLIWMGELKHKTGISDRLDTRRSLRRSRRHRKTRYRQPGFDNRKRNKGWLPPSLNARVDQIMNVVNKLRKITALTSISTEHAKFDTQLMQNPEIKGIEYQQGELCGYEVKEYLLEKFNHTCAYCKGTAKDQILEVEHIVPRNPKRGQEGTDSVSNLAIACSTCNAEKGNLQPEEWIEKLRKSKRQIDKTRLKNFPKVIQKLKEPLKDAAIINATRWELYRRLKGTGLPVECGTGARTKKQRIEHNLPKTHYYDSVCVGESTPTNIRFQTTYVYTLKAIGRGIRQNCRTDKYGFPVAHKKNQKEYFGFQTGDMVIAEVPKGKYKGKWLGRVAVRSSGYFDIKNSYGKRMCQGVSHKYMRLLQKGNGWQYSKEVAIPPHQRSVQ